MPLAKETTQTVIEKYKTHEGDTGSPEVQIALLTSRISMLTEHFQTHKKDHHSRRGLFLLIGQRKRLMAYLAKTNIQRYRTLMTELGIRSRL
jgi:small subunit ribosomal protein S15